MFCISADDLSKVYDYLYAHYTRHGYSNWEYWRTTQDASAHFADLLEEALSDADPDAWDKVWTDWLASKEQPTATGEE